MFVGEVWSQTTNQYINRSGEEDLWERYADKSGKEYKAASDEPFDW
jgi:hypothetical protein